MSLVNIRRLATIDMSGVSGSARRQRIIPAEFIIGVIGMVGFGVWVSTNASDITSRMLGLWLVGAGLNYALLAVWAVILSRRGALDAELAGPTLARNYAAMVSCNCGSLCHYRSLLSSSRR